MPTITVHQEDLYRLAGWAADSPLAQLEEALARLVKGELGSRTLDGLRLRGADGVWAPADQNYKLRIELKDTNRPDLWCVEGIARQLRDHARGVSANYDFFTQQPASLVIEVEPALESIRPYIGGFLAQGGVVDEESLLALIETQETLTRNFGHQRKTLSMGIYDGASLLFPLQYKAVPPDGVRFTPLPPSTEQETWPAGVRMTPAEVLDRHPTGRTYGWILEGKALVPFLTDVQGEVLSFPPIINSARLGRVVPGMDALFVEVTGLAQDQCLLALNILASNLADRGWRITPVTTNYPYPTARGPQVTVPHAMPIDQRAPLGEFARLLGEAVGGEEVVTRLRAYGVEARLEGDQVVATSPSYRQDYLHVVDVIEDYAISRGYETLAPSMAQEFTVGRLHPFTELADLVRDRMISFGFEEAICNILTNNESVRTWMNLPTEGEQVFQGLHGGRLVRIANVMNLNYSVLRDWITPSLLEVEAHSVGALYPHRLFEVGEVAVYEATANHGSRSETRLAALIAEEEASFDSAQSVVYALLTALKIPFRVVAWAHPSFITGRVALIIADDERPLGFLGELAPQVLTHWGVRMPTAVVEVAVDRLYAYTLGKQ